MASTSSVRVGRTFLRTKRASDRWTATVMLAPAGIVLVVVFLLPLVFSLWSSVQATGTPVDQVGFVGGDQYARIVDDPAFWRALRISLVFTAVSVAGVYLLGLVVALLVMSRAPLARFVQTVSIFPWAMPLVAAAMLWATILDYQYGPAGWIVRSAGLGDSPVGWLTDPRLALLSVMGVQIWTLFPMAGVMLLAGLQSIPGERIEAAEVDGASAWQRFRHVTLPGLRPVSAVLLLLLTIWIFGRSFTIIFVLTGGGPSGATSTLVIETFERGFQMFDLQSASALGAIVLVISLLITAVYSRFALRSNER